MTNASRIVLAIAVALFTAACGTSLTSAPRADDAPRRQSAVAAANGVRLVARTGAWQGTPTRLDEELTPLLVTIENRGAAPVHIAYDAFRLVSHDGRRYAALPPFSIEDAVPAAVGAPYYAPVGFGYAPYMRPYFSSERIFPFEPDRGYWDRYAPRMSTLDLPTADMLRKALPEGVLEPGGRVIGFVYFEAPAADVERVRFIATFRDPRSGAEVARMALPLTLS